MNSATVAIKSNGFKSGLFNPTGQDVSRFIPPEKIDAYEIGYKTVTSGGVRFDASTFYYDYRNLQVASYRNTSAIVTSAKNARASAACSRAGSWSSRSKRLSAAWTTSNCLLTMSTAIRTTSWCAAR